MKTTLATGLVSELCCSARLPSAILAAAKSFSPQRAATFLAGRALLAELMFTLFNQSTLAEIVIQPGGKPVFADPAQPEFSLSHSGNRLLVAISKHGAVGCDIEVHRDRPNMLRLAQAVFSVEEQSWLSHQPQPKEAFWQLWCLREAALKQQGSGIWAMAELSINPQLQTFSSSATGRLFHGLQDGNSLALALPGDVKEIECLHYDPLVTRLVAVPDIDWLCYQHKE
ncbi:4'-phosphopantetheinyl transferase superfamily protein [Rouxiella sp. WC2420]|uniref:4'-phosphopantetheinyl transferase superfamily protein n=1 Tax=Rouxiella sp. WC2420 TaxID=3234145 RepID=A0AB39VUU1_9GAMM